MRFNSGKVIWRSHEAPKRERFVLRSTHTDGLTIEETFRKKHEAIRHAEIEKAAGNYVEVIDTDYGW